MNFFAEIYHAAKRYIPTGYIYIYIYTRKCAISRNGKVGVHSFTTLYTKKIKKGSLGHKKSFIQVMDINSHNVTLFI